MGNKTMAKTARRTACALGAFALLAATVAGGGIFYVNAEETDKTIPIASVTNDLATIVQSNWVDSVAWEDSGIVNVIDNTNGSGSRWGGAGLTKQFDVTEGKEVKVTFRKPIFSGTETTGNGERALNENMDASAAVDIRLENKNNGKTALIRLWCDGAKMASQGATYVEVHDPRGDWTKYNVGDWIAGVATDTSSFTIGYNSTDYLCMDIAGGSFGKINSNTDGYKAFLEEVFDGCETLEVMWGREIKAGTKDITTVQNVNGQSLIPVEGKITDNVAPVVPKIKVSEGEIAINTDYSVRCEKWFDDPSTAAQFAIRPAYDIIAGNGLELKCKISSDNGETWKTVGAYNLAKGMIERVRFDKAGAYLIAVEATDTVGNVGTGTSVEITVVKGFDITLGAACPESGTVGTEITLPEATSSDKNEVAHPVTVKVEDPIGMEVTLTDNKFTPTIAGVYYVTYSSEYTDEGGKTVKTKAEYRINVAVATTGDPSGKDPDETDDTDDKGCKSSLGGGIAVGGIALLACGAAATVITLRRKQR